MNTTSQRVRVIVRGQVQGVFFRDTCRREAHHHRVRGWVRNRPDGSVEAVFDGSPDGVRAMVDWVRVGPPTARVDAVEVFAEPSEPSTAPAPDKHAPDTSEPGAGESGFEIRRRG